MAGNQSYQSNWNGAMTQTPIPNPGPQHIPASNQMNQPQQMDMNYGMNNQPFNGFPMMSQMVSPLIIVLVQSEAAVDNYIVERGKTAFLINYDERVFWTKRQKENGLGYETVKHFFCTEDEEKDRLSKNQNGSDSSDYGKLKSDFENLSEQVSKLRHEFDDFMK